MAVHDHQYQKKYDWKNHYSISRFAEFILFETEYPGFTVFYAVPFYHADDLSLKINIIEEYEFNDKACPENNT